MFDKIDTILLNNLMSNCRISNKRLAVISGITEPAVLKRIRNLEEDCILKYDCIINWNLVPLIKKAYFTTLTNIEEIKHQKPVFGLLETIHANKNLVFCFFKNKKQIERFEKLLPEKHSELTFTGFHVRPFTVVDIAGSIKLPKIREGHKIDLNKKDIQILECLCNGGARFSLSKISEQTGLAYDVVRYRFGRLERAGYFSYFIAQPDPVKFRINTVYLWLRFKPHNFVDSVSKLKNESYLVSDNNSVIMFLFVNSFESYMEEVGKITDQFKNQLAGVEVYPIKEAMLLNRYPFDFLE